MSRVFKLFHGGKEITYVDYRGCETDEEMIAVVREAQAKAIKENKKTMLQLADLRGVWITKAYMDELRKVVMETPSFALKRAVLGMETSMARKILLDTYNFSRGDLGPVRSFESEKEALDWLIAP